MTPDQDRLDRLEVAIQSALATCRAEGRTQQECDEVERFYRCPHLPWMPFEDAQTIVMDLALSGDDGTHSNDDVMAANRTSVSASKDERVRLVADRLGVSFDQALSVTEAAREERYAKQLDAAQPIGADTRCALYRHYDQDGVLLYIGIANEPGVRTDQHRYRSAWFQFAATVETEWFDTRQEAADAERAAVPAELAIFNKTYAAPGRAERVVSYLVQQSAFEYLTPSI